MDNGNLNIKSLFYNNLQKYVSNKTFYLLDIDKKPAKGLTVVYKDENKDYYLKDQATLEEVNSDKNELKVRFRNGQLFNQTTLTEIRERINKNL